MNLLEKPFFKKYLLPGFVFQSVIIGGGYGTGRELVEYFLRFGPRAGLLGMVLVTTVIWSVSLALTFEFSRRFRAYDYRRFFRKLLGPFWISYEIFYVVFLLIVLAVLGAASGEMFKNNFELPFIPPYIMNIVGVVVMLAGVGFLTFIGSSLIEKFLSVWSFILYAIYIVFFVVTFVNLGSVIQDNFVHSAMQIGWAVSGFKYAFYNLSAGPVILFCLKHIETRKEAVTAGLLAGVIGIVPGLLFYVSMVGYYPDVVPEVIPSVYVFEKTGIMLLFIIFQIVLYGTFIETGTALIHAVNERIQSGLQAQNMKLPRAFRPISAAAFLLTSLLIAAALSKYGLKNLIGKGYGTASWGFLFVYLIPLASWGLYKIIKSRPSA